MARAETADYDEYVLEVEFDPDGSPGTFSTICGLTDVTGNHTSNMETSEIPDCDDEGLPFAIARAVRSQEVTISATGVWARQSNHRVMSWWRSATTLNTRLRNANAEANGAVDDIYGETGPAFLVSVSNSRTKGQKVTAEVEIQFDGLPDTETVTA